MLTREETSTEPSFAELLEEYEPQPIRPGDYLSGEILKIDDEVALIDIGGKQEAVVPVKELDLLNKEYVENISVGDEVPVYVTSVPIVGGRLTVSIQKGLEQEDWTRAEKLLGSQDVFEREIIGTNKGGLLVKFGRLQGFVPNSHIPDLRRGEDMQKTKSSMIGQTLPVQVLQVVPEKKRLVLTARAAADIRRKQRLEELQVGQTVYGVVKNLVKFGAFVDLDGVDGLVHISELDWKRVDRPSDVLKPGDEIELLVLDVDRERERISLSRKALIPSPIQQFADRYAPGDLIEGTITSVQDYGAFVQLTEDVVGLLHVSEAELSGTGGAPKEMFRNGDRILTRIIEIDPQEERVRLSARRVTYDEYASWAMKDWQEEPGTEAESPPSSSQEEAVPAPEESPDSPEILTEDTVEATPEETAEAAPQEMVDAQPDNIEERSEVQ